MENLKNFFNACIDKFKALDRKILIKATIGICILVVAFSLYGIKNAEAESKNEIFKTVNASEKKDGIENEKEETYDDKIVVQVAGAVAHPKICHMPKDTRVYQIVEEAGGFLPEADPSNLNLAAPVNDGDKIYIPKVGEVSETDDITGKIEKSDDIPSNDFTHDGKININSATREELQQIPGIGPHTADKIVSWRKENGTFRKKEDIKKINGIGDKTFEKMKERIRVN